MVFLHVLFISFFSLSSGLYSASSPVIKLTTENFESEVLKSEDLWIVEFFAPWCGHCKNLAPEYEKAAKALKGFVKLGAVDMTTDQSAGSKYNINGFPTIKFFGEKKSSPLDYDSGRTAKDLISYAFKQAEQLAYKRIGSKPEPPKQERQPEEKPINDGDVIVLTESNFNEVFQSDDVWFVEFYAPWCGHCKKLAPEWAEAATKLKGQVKLAKVDATTEQSLANKYGIKGYPTIKVFLPGSKEPEDYNGSRDAEGIVRTALNKLDSHGKPPKIPQVTSESVISKNCDKEVCVIAFLPHIYDSSAIERSRYLDTFTEAAKKHRGKPLSFLWAQAGDFYKLEQLFGLGFGYPSVIGLSTSKSRYAVMRSAFNKDEVELFARKLLNGNVSLNEYKELPKLKSVEEWDGKDHEPPSDL